MSTTAQKLTPEEKQQFITRRINHDAMAAPKAEDRPTAVTIPDSAWPAGLKPAPYALPGFTAGKTNNLAIPGPFDAVIITYTTDETRALSFVMTGENNYETKWYGYGHNFATLITDKGITEGLKDENGGKSKLGSGTLCTIIPVKIGSKKVLLVKSELHPAQNGLKLPIIDFIKQIVSEAKPGVLMTGGTGGAVGAHVNIGDAVITQSALFLCEHSYPDYAGIPKQGTPEAKTAISNNVTLASNTYISDAISKLSPLVVPGLNGDIAKLPNAKTPVTWVKPNNSPTIHFKNVADATEMNVISADYFSLDDTNNSEGLEGLGVMNDMDDAFVAYAVKNSGGNTKWLSVRNASEPQIKYEANEKDMKNQASTIYETCGYNTSINGAFAFWAVALGL